VAPAEIAPRRMSEMGHAAYQANLPELPPPPMPANQQTPAAAAEAESQPETQQPETPPEAEPQEGAPTVEQLAAEWQKHKDSPDLDLDAFGDKVIWTKDRDGNQVPMRVSDIPRHTMLYGDYQAKTTEMAKERRVLEQHQAGIQAFQRDLLSGDPQLGMKAMRWMGAEKTMHGMVVAYVQRMARLEGLAPDVREEFLAGERAKDEADMLRRQLQARQLQEQQLAQSQAAQQGIQAPDIQHVMGHIEQRLPDVCKAMGVTDSPAFQRELGEVLARATEGERGPDGRWIVAPTIQRGRTPTDESLRQLVGEARERVQALIAAAGGRQPPRQQLPPPPAAAAVSGPAAKPGTAGNISTPERRRLSDMR
jgi:hypothetical protein